MKKAEVLRRGGVSCNVLCMDAELVMGVASRLPLVSARTVILNKGLGDGHKGDQGRGRDRHGPAWRCEEAALGTLVTV